MWFLNWLKEIYAGEEMILGVTAIIAGGLVLTALVSFALGNASVYASFAFIFGGGVGIAVACGGVGQTAGIVSVSALLIFGGVVYLLLFSLLAVRRILRERKTRRREIRRRMQYMLPDRENSYVRTRLNTVLNVPKTGMDPDMDIAKADKNTIKLGYARQLLNKVREAPLSTAERLQAEEMERAFALYLHKDGWTAEELQAINEICACILKLSAKYSV